MIQERTYVKSRDHQIAKSPTLPAMKAIVFDFDGVIVNTERWHYESLVAVTRTFDVDFDYAEYLRVYASFDDRDCFDFALRAKDASVEPAVSPHQIEDLVAKKSEAFQTLVRQGVQPIPGVRPIIEAAAAMGLPLAIASGALGHEIMQLLEATELTKYFETVVSADLVAKSKPDPESYAMAVQRLAAFHKDLDLKPGDCLAIEDTVGGLKSASAAGLRTLAVCTTFGPDKLNGHAERVVAGFEKLTLDDLLAWYEVTSGGHQTMR